ncbi:MAG: hypothetical protein ACLU3I_09735 [Acutalibacteraceae bacterium]
MKKQLRGLFCAAALAAVMALPARAAEQTHRAYLCGYPDGSIQPVRPSRGRSFACALVRLAEEPLPEPERVTFFDVPGDHWASRADRKAHGLGICCRSETGGWFSPSSRSSAGGSCAAVLDTLADSETGRESISGADWCVGRENGL